MSTYQQVRDARLSDPSCNKLEKQFLQDADQKDILDVMLVLQDLTQVFARKYEEVTGRRWAEDGRR